MLSSMQVRVSSSHLDNCLHESLVILFKVILSYDGGVCEAIHTNVISVAIAIYGSIELCPLCPLPHSEL